MVRCSAATPLDQPASVAGLRDRGSLPKTIYLTGWAPEGGFDLVAALG